MIRTVEALHYRSLRYVRQDLQRFHVLVGPNASGKTTFFDVIRFLGDLVAGGLDAAIAERTDNLRDLFWLRQGGRFELAVEIDVPDAHGGTRTYDGCRYEIAIGIDPESQENAILAERVLLFHFARGTAPRERTLFPERLLAPETVLTPRNARGVRTLVNKGHNGNDTFYDETGKGWDHAFRLGRRRSALGNLPEDESKFPVATHLKRLLNEGPQSLVLNSALMRRASPPGQATAFRPDGANLPWVVEDLRRRDPRRVQAWVAHLRTALPDVGDVPTVERPEDRHRYIVGCYEGSLQAPAWMVSDGTLRLLALTLPAYLPGLRGVYLIEEPENGIHPRAVETMYQSLSSMYGAQVLMATHSPVILSLAQPSDVLCFARTADGSTDIVNGAGHPGLQGLAGRDEPRRALRGWGVGMTLFAPPVRDLVVLVADKNMESTVQGILARPESVPMRPVVHSIFVHPERDPGCLLHSAPFLRPLRRGYARALVMFDREGCGREDLTRLELCEMVRAGLANSGWSESGAAVCVDPELENWVWSDSPEVLGALGWSQGRPSVRLWLKDQGLWPDRSAKPPRPKEALEKVLYELRKQRSSSLCGTRTPCRIRTLPRSFVCASAAHPSGLVPAPLNPGAGDMASSTRRSPPPTQGAHAATIKAPKAPHLPCCRPPCLHDRRVIASAPGGPQRHVSWARPASPRPPSASTSGRRRPSDTGIRRGPRCLPPTRPGCRRSSPTRTGTPGSGGRPTRTGPRLRSSAPADTPHASVTEARSRLDGTAATLCSWVQSPRRPCPTARLGPRPSRAGDRRSRVRLAVPSSERLAATPTRRPSWP